MDKSFSSPDQSAGDGIPRLDMQVFLERHLAGRWKILAALATQLEGGETGKRIASGSDWTTWLVEGYYPRRLPVKDNGQIDTRNVLIDALHDLARQGRMSWTTDAVVQKLRQKYEVFGRMAVRYTSEIRKCGEEWAGQEVYGLLAYILLCQFSQEHDYRHLNTALKLADQLDGSPPEAWKITFAVLHHEREIIEEAFGQM